MVLKMVIPYKVPRNILPVLCFITAFGFSKINSHGQLAVESWQIPDAIWCFILLEMQVRYQILQIPQQQQAHILSVQIQETSLMDGTHLPILTGCQIKV